MTAARCRASGRADTGVVFVQQLRQPWPGKSTLRGDISPEFKGSWSLQPVTFVSLMASCRHAVELRSAWREGGLPCGAGAVDTINPISAEKEGLFLCVLSNIGKASRW